jgi:hypothetical protein
LPLLVRGDDDHLGLHVALTGGHLADVLHPGTRLQLLLLLEQLNGGDGLLLLPPLLSRGRCRGLRKGPRELGLFLKVAMVTADDWMDRSR